MKKQALKGLVLSALLIVSSVAMFGCKGGKDSVNVSNNVSRSEAKSLASKVSGTWKGCSGLQYTSRSSLVVDDVTTNGEVYCTFNYLYMGAGYRTGTGHVSKLSEYQPNGADIYYYKWTLYDDTRSNDLVDYSYQWFANKNCTRIMTALNKYKKV